MSAIRRAASVRLLAGGAVEALRSGVYEGRDHVVVPVVALVGDSVIRATGSAGPEFVPALELSRAPLGWNGRPVTIDHPGEGALSANTPEILERYRIGTVFNAAYEDKRLKLEAWIDPELVARAGGEAERVFELIRSGSMVEVSVGCFISAEKSSGVAADGKRYEIVWRDVVPDHVAILPEGVVGACSVEAGCGAPRAAAGEEDENMKTKTKQATSSGGGGLRRLFARAAELLASAPDLRSGVEDEGKSDSTLRGELCELLNKTVPAFDGVAEFYPESKTVIYWVAPDYSGPLQWWRQTYEASEGGVSLTGTAEQVEPVTRYEPVEEARAASAEPEAEREEPEQVVEPEARAAAGCGCDGTKDGDGNPARHNEENRMNDKLKQLVGRLVACERSPFRGADAATQTALEQLGEDRLRALADALEAGNPDPAAAAGNPPAAAPNATQTVVADAPKELTEEEQEAKAIEALPARLRAWYQRQKEAEAAEKADLVKNLRGASGQPFSEEELASKDVDELQKLAALAGLNADGSPRNFGTRVLPEAGSRAAADPQPNGYEAALAARKAGAGATN